MQVQHVLVAALAAAVIAAPGVALAQGGDRGNAAGSSGAYSAGNGAEWNRNVGNSYVNQYSPPQIGNGQALSPQEFAAARIGLGGYTGLPLPIRNNNSNNNAGNVRALRISQRNDLLADNGDARASKVIGTAVFNSNDQKLGSVDDVLIGHNGVWAIISTNNKKVAVPFQALVFGDQHVNGDDVLVLPNVTEAELNTLPVFYYNATNYPIYGNNNGPGWVGANNNAGRGANSRYRGAFGWYGPQYGPYGWYGGSPWYGPGYQPGVINGNAPAYNGNLAFAPGASDNPVNGGGGNTGSSGNNSRNNNGRFGYNGPYGTNSGPQYNPNSGGWFNNGAGPSLFGPEHGPPSVNNGNGNGVNG